MTKYNAPDIKRINHALKVTSFAEMIAEGENIAKKEKELLLSAAVLHDIGIHEAEKQYNSTDGKYQEILGREIAKKILKTMDYTAEEIERICFLVGNHHTYSIKNDLLLRILIEADFIVNIEEGDFPSGTNYQYIKEKNFSTETGKMLFDILKLG
jgi:HD superfamily phosphodiesterase